MTLPRRLLALLVVVVPLSAAAGKDPAQPADLFDFWVGDWNAKWKNKDGTDGRGRNVITKALDGKVLEENFEAEGTAKVPGLKGKSLSVLEKGGTWRQTWADNQGGFIVLAAQVDGEKKMFVTAGKESFQRMVFSNIKKDSFTWDWESTTDGGKTWSLAWRIEYERRPEEKKPGK
jgi:hypothetical protein